MEHSSPCPMEFVSRIASTVPRSVLEEYATHRLYFALRRFANNIRKVTVRLSDQNGPRGGVDTRCVIAVDLERGGALLVEATAAWPATAIDAAAKRISETLRRRGDRAHRVTDSNGRQ
jgi:putative sigma-54 modulation protein